MKRKILLLALFLSVISEPSAQVIFEPSVQVSSEGKYFLQNCMRVLVGTGAMAIPTFALIIGDSPTPLFFFPLASAAGVYATGRLQKYDGKFWAILSGAYIVGLPWALAIWYIIENPVDIDPEEGDNIHEILALAAFTLPIFANFGFNLSTNNKDEVLSVTFFDRPPQYSHALCSNNGVRRKNRRFCYRATIVTLNF